MKLHELQPGPKKKRKRVGRGISSGRGKTAGRGMKGQKSRSGGKLPPFFEGGQTPLVLRLPKKRGFKSLFKKNWQIVNVGKLSQFSSGQNITPEVLEKEGIIKSAKGLVKILGEGTLERKLTVTADAFSGGA